MNKKPGVETQLIRQWIKRFLSQDDLCIPLDHLRRNLPDSARLLVIGGALRNLILENIGGKAPRTEDIDVIIADSPLNFHFRNTLKNQRFRRTELRGVRWFPPDSGYSFDLSFLSDFVTLRYFSMESTVENLLSVIDFNVNAVIYDTKNEVLIEKNIFQALSGRVMDFNTTRIVDTLLIAYRLLILRNKLNFFLSERTFHFLRNAVDVNTLISLKSVLNGKLGKERAEAILKDYDAICSFTRYETYCRSFRDL